MLFFSFFFIAQKSTETLETHYTYTYYIYIGMTPTLFLFIKAIYFFPSLLHFTESLWTGGFFFLIRRNLVPI